MIKDFFWGDFLIVVIYLFSDCLVFVVLGVGDIIVNKMIRIFIFGVCGVATERFRRSIVKRE